VGHITPVLHRPLTIILAFFEYITKMNGPKWGRKQQMLLLYNLNERNVAQNVGM
jgi:hypothetical protein